MKIKIILTGISFLFFSFPALSGDFLSGDQITKAFSGKTIQWEHMFKDKSGKSYFSTDGKLTGIKNSSIREGKWHVENDELCVSWGKCLAIEPDGKGGFYKVKNGTKQVVHIKSVTDGNNL